MFNKILPQHIDNTYRGYKFALWLFGLVVALRIAQSLLVIFNGYSTAISADGIPLDTYPPDAAQTVVAISALGALSRLLISLSCILVLVRYRSAISLMFTLLLLNYLASQLIFYFIPLATTQNKPAPVVNLIAFVLMIVGLALSLRSPETHSLSAE